MTNLAHIAETALLLLAAYLLGCVLGYATRLVLHAGRGTRQVAPPAAAAVTAPLPEPRKPRSSAARLAARVEEPLPPAPNAAPAPSPVMAAQPPVRRAAKATSSGPRPATLSEPRNGQADNLKQIKGIGPKIEASLYAMGIFHIDQIAGWNKANVDWVDAQLSFKGRIRRERWVEQALELGITRAHA
ncbi:hypothetical protein [Devosia sp.]|uniref:hypothetical protein n=1 Tax=Devosia sp. TaxID=1871048 RepID=UPI0029303C5B|nr:hypothetical protein [Devosia sp.]